MKMEAARIAIDRARRDASFVRALDATVRRVGYFAIGLTTVTEDAAVAALREVGGWSQVIRDTWSDATADLDPIHLSDLLGDVEVRDLLTALDVATIRITAQNAVLEGRNER